MTEIKIIIQLFLTREIQTNIVNPIKPRGKLRFLRSQTSVEPQNQSVNTSLSVVVL